MSPKPLRWGESAVSGQSPKKIVRPSLTDDFDDLDIFDRAAGLRGAVFIWDDGDLKHNRQDDYVDFGDDDDYVDDVVHLDLL